MSDEKQDPVVGKITQLTDLSEYPHLAKLLANIPQEIINAALLAERCKEPLPEKMKAGELLRRIDDIQQAMADLKKWNENITAYFLTGICKIDRYRIVSHLSDTEYDAKKDAQAESEAGNE